MSCSTPDADTDDTYFLYTNICYIHNLRGSTRRQKRLHNEEFHDWYSSPSIIQLIKLWRMRWVGKVAWVGGGAKKRNRSAYGGLFGGGNEGKCLLGRHGHRSEDNIQIYLK